MAGRRRLPLLALLAVLLSLAAYSWLDGWSGEDLDETDYDDADYDYDEDYGDGDDVDEVSFRGCW